MKKFIVISIVLLMIAGFVITSSALACEFTMDIKPQSCPNPLNVKSKGVLPVAIIAWEGFDVTEIDPMTIELVGVAPLRWDWEDVATPSVLEECTTAGPDGWLDLTLKFDNQEVVAALGTVEDGDVICLTLTFELLDGRLIEDFDFIIIIKKGK